jgi:hypothetical protein
MTPTLASLRSSGVCSTSYSAVTEAQCARWGRHGRRRWRHHQQGRGGGGGGGVPAAAAASRGVGAHQPQQLAHHLAAHRRRGPAPCRSFNLPDLGNDLGRGLEVLRRLASGQPPAPRGGAPSGVELSTDGGDANGEETPEPQKPSVWSDWQGIGPVMAYLPQATAGGAPLCLPPALASPQLHLPTVLPSILFPLQPGTPTAIGSLGRVSTWPTWMTQPRWQSCGKRS